MELKELFLELLTSSVRQTQWNKNDLILENKDWSSLLTLSAFHQVIPLVYEAVCKMESFRQHPPAVAGMWKKEAVMSMVRQTRATKDFLCLYSEMCSLGMKPLVLKGLICRNLYPKPDYRMSSDEDLLVSREDFWKMNDFLIKKGFRKEETDDSLRKKIDKLHEVSYFHPQTGLYLEVHLTLFPEESGAYGHFNSLFEDLHNSAVSIKVEDYRIWTLDYTEHLLFLLCHNVKHFLHSGFGIRQVFDMILFAEAYGHKIDWKRLTKTARKNRIYVFLIHLFDIGVRYLKFEPKKACWPSGEMPLNGTLDSKDLLEDILSGGLYGTSTEERRHSSNITLAAAQRERKHTDGIVSALFPALSYMKKNYPYVKKYPWLLPAAWCQRLWEYFGRKRYINNRKVVKTGYNRVKLLKKYGIVPGEK